MFVRAARISHESQTTKFSVHVILVAVARSSSGDDAIPCILPVLWMTSCVPTTDQAKATQVTRRGQHPFDKHSQTDLSLDRWRSLMSTIVLCS